MNLVLMSITIEASVLIAAVGLVVTLLITAVKITSNFATTMNATKDPLEKELSDLKVKITSAEKDIAETNAMALRFKDDLNRAVAASNTQNSKDHDGIIVHLDKVNEAINLVTEALHNLVASFKEHIGEHKGIESKLDDLKEQIKVK